MVLITFHLFWNQLEHRWEAEAERAKLWDQYFRSILLPLLGKGFIPQYFYSCQFMFFYIFAPKASWHEGGTMVPWGCGDRWTLSFSILHWEMNFLPFCYTLRDEFVALLVHIERWISMSRWQTLRGGGLRSTWLRWISWAWIFSSWRPAWTTRSTS